MKLRSPIPRPRVRIEIIPLIDIMFFLLASFMMVSLQLDQASNIKVHLPKATQAPHDFQPNLVNIAVDKTGVVWLEKKPISLTDLGVVISNRFRLDTNLPVYLSGDQDTKHGAMLDVLQVVRHAGVQKIGFMVDGPAGPTPSVAP